MTGFRERIGLGVDAGPTNKRDLFEQYGLFVNPFPPASQPMGHPHRQVAADDEIESRLRAFVSDSVTQVLVVQGTQGLGKTNLLEHYQKALAEGLAEEDGYYIVRYLPDPEPSFGRVVRRLFQEFGVEGLLRLRQRWQDASAATVEEAFAGVRSPEVRTALTRLGTASEEGAGEAAILFLDFLTGSRVLKRHREVLGVSFRLDTTESMIQSLHDLVSFSSQIGHIRGIFLFIDELEKQGGLTARATTAYLYSIRALVDALPSHLFLVLAMTRDAKERYSEMLPALADRLGQVLELRHIQSSDEALDLAKFYVDNARESSLTSSLSKGLTPGDKAVLSLDAVRQAFFSLYEASTARARQGVTPRAFLDRLHNLASPLFEPHAD